MLLPSVCSLCVEELDETVVRTETTSPAGFSCFMDHFTSLVNSVFRMGGPIAIFAVELVSSCRDLDACHFETIGGKDGTYSACAWNIVDGRKGVRTCP